MSKGTNVHEGFLWTGMSYTHYDFSVLEGEAAFMMQCYWRLEWFFDNRLIFYAAFPCLLAEFENSMKETGKNGGEVWKLSTCCCHVEHRFCATGVEARLTRPQHGKLSPASLTVPARNMTQFLTEKPRFASATSTLYAVCVDGWVNKQCRNTTLLLGDLFCLFTFVIISNFQE